MLNKMYKNYELNKKYAIRKLSVGIASVSLGLFAVYNTNLIPELNIIDVAKADEIENSNFSKERYEELRSNYKNAERIYNEAQLKVEEKAEKVKALDLELQNINTDVQYGYLDVIKAEREYNQNKKNKSYKIKLDEANNKLNTLKNKQKEKERELNDLRSLDVPDNEEILNLLDKIKLAKEELKLETEKNKTIIEKIKENEIEIEKTTIYNINDNYGDVTENVSKKVLSEPKIEKTIEPYKTIYQVAPEEELNKRTVKNKGVNGEIIKTYSIIEDENGNYKYSDTPTSVEYINKEYEIIEIGIPSELDKTNWLKENIPYQIEIKEDPELPIGEVEVFQEGEDGTRITAQFYSLNTETGDVIVKKAPSINPYSEVIKDAKNKIIKVGIKGNKVISHIYNKEKSRVENVETIVVFDKEINRNSNIKLDTIEDIKNAIGLKIEKGNIDIEKASVHILAKKNETNGINKYILISYIEEYFTRNNKDKKAIEDINTWTDEKVVNYLEDLLNLDKNNNRIVEDEDFMSNFSIIESVENLNTDNNEVNGDRNLIIYNPKEAVSIEGYEGTGPEKPLELPEFDVNQKVPVTINYYKEGTKEKIIDSVVKEVTFNNNYTTEELPTNKQRIEVVITNEDNSKSLKITEYKLTSTPNNSSSLIDNINPIEVNYEYKEIVTIKPINVDVDNSNQPEEETNNKIETPVNEVPEYKGPLSTNTPVDDNGNLVLPPVVEIPEYTGTISINTPIDENGNLILPPTIEKPEFNGNVNSAEPPIVEKPKYTEPISTNTPVDDNGNQILPPIENEPEYTGDLKETPKEETVKETTKEETKVEDKKDKELPNTNSTSVITGFVSSLIGTLGLGYKSKRKK